MGPGCQKRDVVKRNLWAAGARSSANGQPLVTGRIVEPLNLITDVRPQYVALSCFVRRGARFG